MDILTTFIIFIILWSVWFSITLEIRTVGYLKEILKLGKPQVKDGYWTVDGVRYNKLPERLKRVLIKHIINQKDNGDNPQELLQSN